MTFENETKIWPAITQQSNSHVVFTYINVLQQNSFVYRGAEINADLLAKLFPMDYFFLSYQEARSLFN